MSKPIKTFRMGAVQLAVWQGEFEGKPTTSFSLKKQKFNKTTNQWEDSPFWNQTDLCNAQACITACLSKMAEKPTGQAAGLSNPQYQQQNIAQRNVQNVQQTFQQPPNMHDPWAGDDNMPF